MLKENKIPWKNQISPDARAIEGLQLIMFKMIKNKGLKLKEKRLTF